MDNTQILELPDAPYNWSTSDKGTDVAVAKMEKMLPILWIYPKDGQCHYYEFRLKGFEWSDYRSLKRGENVKITFRGHRSGHHNYIKIVDGQVSFAYYLFGIDNVLETFLEVIPYNQCKDTLKAFYKDIMRMYW